MKRISKIVALFACMSVFTVFALGSGSSGSSSSNNNSNTNSEPIAEKEEEPESNSITSLGENFDEAVKAIGMDPEWVKNINQLDDWASGTRYSFVYDGYEYKVYILDNGEINSICNGNLTAKIYERGYEPLNYKDFEPDAAILDSLMEMGLKAVGEYILNEETIKNKLGTTTFYRIYNYYSFHGEAVAKNEVDKDKFSFTVDFLIDGSNAEVTYVSIDGVSYYGSQDVIPEIPKVELSESSDGAASGEKIVLSDGILGEYGQNDLFDGEEFIRYYVPAGKYEVNCVVRGGFYIETIELHKEEGWDTATTIDQIWMDAGETTTINIEEGQCISLIINTELELTPVE